MILYFSGANTFWCAGKNKVAGAQGNELRNIGNNLIEGKNHIF